MTGIRITLDLHQHAETSGDKANGFCAEAIADGFDSPDAFRDYFVPNLHESLRCDPVQVVR